MATANDRLLGEIVWPHFWVVQLWLVVLLFMYCAMRELVRTIGPHEVKRMFFGPGRGRATRTTREQGVGHE